MAEKNPISLILFKSLIVLFIGLQVLTLPFSVLASPLFLYFLSFSFYFWVLVFILFLRRISLGWYFALGHIFLSSLSLAIDFFTNFSQLRGSANWFPDISKGNDLPLSFYSIEDVPTIFQISFLKLFDPLIAAYCFLALLVIVKVVFLVCVLSKSVRQTMGVLTKNMLYNFFGIAIAIGLLSTVSYFNRKQQISNLESIGNIRKSTKVLNDIPKELAK